MQEDLLMNQKHGLNQTDNTDMQPMDEQAVDQIRPMTAGELDMVNGGMLIALILPAIQAARESPR